MSKKSFLLVISMVISLGLGIFSIGPVIAEGEACVFLDSRSKDKNPTKVHYILVGGVDTYDWKMTEVFSKDTNGIEKAIREKSPTADIFSYPGGPTLEGIRNALRSLKEGDERAKSGEEVVLIYVGHGNEAPPRISWGTGEANKLWTPGEMREDLSGFEPGVSVKVVLIACYSSRFGEDISKVKDSKGNLVLAVGFWGLKGKGLALKAYPYYVGTLTGDKLMGAIKEMKADENKDGIIKFDELRGYMNSTLWVEDFDGDGKIGEDPVEHMEYPNGTVTHLLIDNDNDGYVDEDPGPIETYSYSVIRYPPVGGFSVPIANSKPDLSSFYIGLTSIIAVAAVATAIYVKHVKHRKQKR